MLIDLETEFLTERDKLSSYLYRLTANREDTEDLLQDTYIRVKEKFSTFRGQSSFKTWLFTIATNLAHDNKRVKNRWELDAQDHCKNAAATNKYYQDRMINAFQNQVEKQFEIEEHINYCFTCIAKNLTLEKQIAIILKEIYDFKRTEIAEILNITEGVVKHLLHDGRKKLQEKYEQRCALINKNGVCYQCAQLNNYFQVTKNAEEKIKKLPLSENYSSEENLDHRFNIINRINPLNGNGAKLEDTILQILRETIHDN
jgi:RNA polymerase sigma-70 factor (ECF subfamily)